MVDQRRPGSKWAQSQRHQSGAANIRRRAKGRVADWQQYERGWSKGTRVFKVNLSENRKRCASPTLYCAGVMH